ncbi:MAG: UPF0182 family protein [Candidatus Dormibacteria bacterium]
MTSFGFDPEQFFKRRRPRVLNRRPPSRGRRIAGIILVVTIAVFIAAASLLGQRVNFLFLDSLGHSNVFWTPLITEGVLFLIGFAILAGLIGLSVPLWVRIASCLDERAARVAKWVGIGIAVVAGIAGGSSLAGQWQEVLLFLHGQSFGAQDPVFHQDFGFFVFTLPVVDAFSALLWGGVIIGLVGAVGLTVFSAVVINAPDEIDFPLNPVKGRTAEQGLRLGLLHVGIALVGVFVLASLGAHFGVYHLATATHDPSYVGLDASQRNVNRPVFGFLQIAALAFAVFALIIVVTRRRAASRGTGAALIALMVVWLAGSGLLQSVPGAIYQSTTVNPNAQSAQKDPIVDFLSTSRYAWGLNTKETNPSNFDISTRPFGNVAAPTLADIAADPGTLRNVRIQDYRQLPDTFAQIDRSRSYQNYPTITVDRYRNADGTESQVMLGPREVAEADLPNQNFISKGLIYTHGYGITAVSVNRIGAEGKPAILAGGQPLSQVAPDAPAALTFNGSKQGDPRLYCGASTTQPVVVNTSQDEFDYPVGSVDKTNHAGPGMAGFPISGLDKLATSISQFGGLDLFLTNSVTGDSRVLLHREIKDRVQTVAPFLTLDQDPYLVADPASNHLVWIADGYVKTDRFPESFRQSDGTSYMRNSVKAVVDARTCAVTLYAVDLNEPLTAAWNAIYPGLLTPLGEMPLTLKQHLRYPEDLFQAQVQAYAAVHVTDAGAYFNKNDLYRPADEYVTDNSGSSNKQPSQAYYVEITPPGANKPEFVLLQTFSPGQSGNGTPANNMTAWLAAESDYTVTNHPKLIAVPLNNAANVLGPLQFDNNINTNQAISRDITLLGQRGSKVILGNVITLPFNNNSFLYVRPFYVLANSSSGGGTFPQLLHIIVGTQNAIGYGDDFPSALQDLFKTKEPIPGLPLPISGGTPSPSPTATPSPGTTTPTPAPGATPGPSQNLTPQELALLNDLLQHQANVDAAYAKGDLATAGSEQAKVKDDAKKLRDLLPGASPPPSATP